MTALRSARAPGAAPAVITLGCLDPVLRSSAVAGLVCDVPGTVVVQHDRDDALGGYRRTVFDQGGVIESTAVDLGGGCLTCGLRQDLVEVVGRLARRRPPVVILALPVAVEPATVVPSLRQLGPMVRVAAVVTVAENQAVERDLFGDDLLVERGLGLSSDDRRAVGEVLAHQLEYSDAVLFPQAPDPRLRALLAHLSLPPFVVGTGEVHGDHGSALAAIVRPVADPRGDLAHCAPSPVEDGEGVWTLDLVTDRPLHPERLVERIEDLGTGPIRGRGHLWLPTRPGIVVGWDGAGGQLSIGSVGPWTSRRGTRLVVTGVRAADRLRLSEVFEAVQLRPAELHRGLSWWAGREDDLDPWLGEIADCA